ncbi:TIGR03557 family F420-dependent LLM class oxidoreductase [Nocardioides sp. MAH-18]|uniref:TIGR03557 family F420-dependent LLM class oxidoreductase n=1 Tax=Nocardioides agri TaxID=2682843 RepID=A0A6L6XNH4_9ACTN|nr:MULTISPECIES: TIGR03557 family F420-dependent LLM class oxidoreductase [unclassified Nocardioides]MBA2953278.1 TIGR03557 family F420-dependent LLM class oxidoreductase [Nocardioides sp. CGMCC 1.13656]MVQ48146.1 TIGR03557 family F420-dependent LLM class oxidoreductase [Nocardioides sp. MAH-18]
MRIGYFLSTEEYTPADLVAQARAAEQAGFTGLWISDHFHPWNNEQGNSPLVWSVIGAISQVCDLHVTTAVTCPTVRVHPAIVAQAAGTCAELLDGRFTLGVGTGEALNESILGGPWPTLDVRLEMLEEAVGLIRELWTGEVVSHRGRHYTVEHARIYNVPEVPPEIFVSAFGPKAVDVAARIGDGYIGTSPDADLVGRFKEAAGDRPAQAGAKVAFASSREEGWKHAHRLWPNAGLPGEMAQILPTPEHFEQATQLVTMDSTRESVVAGNELEDHLEQIEKYADAGYDELYVANMGPHFLEMIEFYGERVLPAVT